MFNAVASMNEQGAGPPALASCIGVAVDPVTSAQVRPVMADPAAGYKPTSPVIADVGTFEISDCARILKLAADPMMTGAGPCPPAPAPVPAPAAVTPLFGNPPPPPSPPPQPATSALSNKAT